MRLFVALVPPPDILDELEEAVLPHKDDVPELKWIRRELLHVTLAFLGECDDRTVDRLLPRLERAARRHERMTLSLAGGGAFPSNGAHARVLWTGLYGDRRGLARLAASVAAAGRRAGTPPDKHRSFRPHMTLARSRQPIDVRPLMEALSAFATGSWTADAVQLMCSHLPGRQYDQLTYEPLKTWSLRYSSGGGGAGRSASGGPQGTP
ncbi:RNA 2',3'-cyclic phosphodiesterase [Actinomadura nitritigenes]|uniref:RNA 2',3'-cyclic phosphodiesterase n=1 Tax=Actinomadura nitritigenes TaxID=134602 RepID=A0ABS3RDY9_9ACTN|nr:RNA 2',3'-cyclic phosphodiesterase [Actinomadura nitritigenes]MBO2444439.1 RNA 2',3'-cyclic phosphodiesterase [Actinomadura nitritigenes]